RDFHVTGVQTCALPILFLNEVAIPFFLSQSTSKHLPEYISSLESDLESSIGSLWYPPERKYPSSLNLICCSTKSGRGMQSPSLKIGRASCRERVYISVW